jgi:hypothetical protein
VNLIIGNLDGASHKNLLFARCPRE